MSNTAVRAYAAERHFSAGTLERWLALPDGDRDVLLSLAARLRLGENQFRDVLDDLHAIAARRAVAVAAVLASDEIVAVLARKLGRNESLRALKTVLRRLRYPQLSAAEQRLAALIRTLHLPAGVRVELPENLEGDAVTIVVRGRSAAEVRAQLGAASTAVAGTGLDEIFAILEGHW